MEEGEDKALGHLNWLLGDEVIQDPVECGKVCQDLIRRFYKEDKPIKKVHPETLAEAILLIYLRNEGLPLFKTSNKRTPSYEQAIEDTIFQWLKRNSSVERQERVFMGAVRLAIKIKDEPLEKVLLERFREVSKKVTLGGKKIGYLIASVIVEHLPRINIHELCNYLDIKEKTLKEYVEVLKNS